MKVAVIHDWLVVQGGAEQVLAEILTMFPEAELYAVVCFLPPDQRGFLQGRVPNTTFIQRLPRAATNYRNYFPLMPLAIEQFDLSSYDLVISSSYCVAKGVVTGPNQVHLSYVHSSARWAWDLQSTYLEQVGLDRGIRGVIARLMLHYFRMWDTRTANGVDHYVANSKFVAARIRKAYGRPATVVHPPVDVEEFALAAEKEDFYLTVSRMVPYKRIPLIVEAFAAMPTKRLIVIGDGPEMAVVRAKAAPNITILGYQPRAAVSDYMRRARAFLFAAEEDFGIAALEAQACGTPVIAYGKGGALETVIGGAAEAAERTGVFFFEQTSSAIITAVEEFEAVSSGISAAVCRRNAMRFAPERFRRELLREVDIALTAHGGYGTAGLSRSEEVLSSLAALAAPVEAPLHDAGWEIPSVISQVVEG
jgi:glycosyltransferase involved in cell wall biosynthesis